MMHSRFCAYLRMDIYCAKHRDKKEEMKKAITTKAGLLVRVYIRVNMVNRG